MKVKDWLETESGKKFFSLVREYQKNVDRPPSEWMPYILVDALESEFEVGILLNEDFEWLDEKVNPYDVWDGVIGWTASDYAADILSVSHLEDVRKEFISAMEWWRDEKEDDHVKEKDD